MDFREQLLQAGVRNLKEFGYPHADTENILTDYVYAKFFAGMLEDTIEEHPGTPVEASAKELLSEIEKVTG